MKKLMLVLSVFLLVLTIIGCDGEKKASGSDEEITLTLWHISKNSRDAIQNAVDRFEVDNPGVLVEVEVLENDPFKTKLKTVMSSGDAPDVFHSWGGGWLESFVDEGLVYDMTDDIEGWKDQLSEAAINMNKFNGRIWGSPITNGSTILYYNKAMFDKLGLTAPTTYEELMQVSEVLKENDIIPFSLGNKSKWPGAQHFVLLSMRLGGSDIFQRALAGDTTFEDPAFIEAGRLLQDMVRNGYFPDGVNGINYDTGGSRMMFYTEKCGMILQTSGFLSSCFAESPEFYNEKLGVAHYPAIEGGKGKATDILAGENAFSISANCENPKEAAKLVEFLSTDQQLHQDFASNSTMPAKIGIENKENKLLTEAMAQLSSATYLQNYIDQTLTPALSERHKDTCQGLFGLTLTPEEAAAEMQALYESSK